MIPIIKPGSFFQVTDYVKNNVYLPGSLGVTASIIPKGGIVWRMSSVIIRRGKKGIDRLERLTFNVPMFKSKCEHLKKDYKAYTDSMIHVEPIPNNLKTVTKITNMEFLAWANAYTWHLQYLSTLMGNSRWYELNAEDIDMAFNINLNFNPNHPSDSYYDFDERVRLLNAIRREEIKMVMQSYQYRLNAHRSIIDNFRNCSAFYNCDEEEKVTIAGYVKASIKKKRTIDLIMSGVLNV